MVVRSLSTQFCPKKEGHLLCIVRRRRKKRFPNLLTFFWSIKWWVKIMGKRLLTIYIIFIFASLISSLSKCPFPGYGTSCAILTIFGTIGRDSRSHGVGFIIFIVAVCLFVCLRVKIKGKRLLTIHIIFNFASLISSLSISGLRNILCHFDHFWHQWSWF